MNLNITNNQPKVPLNSRLVGNTSGNSVKAIVANDTSFERIAKTLQLLVKYLLRASSKPIVDKDKRKTLLDNEFADTDLSTHERQMHEYCIKILGSRMTPSKVNDEIHVSELIKKKLIRENKSTEQALRFTTLFAKLQSQSMLTQRWAILYFLLSISDSSTTRDTIPLDYVFSSGGLYEPTVKETSEDSQNRFMPNIPSSSTASGAKLKTPISNENPPTAEESLPPDEILRNQSTAKHEISEDLLLRDIVFVFQGIDGQYIKFNRETDSYNIDPKIIVNRPTRDLVIKLSEMGLLYGKVDNFVKNKINDSSIGLVGQAFCSALQRELTDYFRLMAILETQITKKVETGSSKGGLSLKRVLVWTQDSLAKLRIMSVLVNHCKEHRGGALVSIIYKYTNHGDPFTQKFINDMLEEVSRPFYEMLTRWIYEGELEDPFEEFFVKCDDDVEEEKLWQLKYSIRSDMQPTFISTTLAKKIFSIGKSLNFIRYSCHDSDWVSTQNQETGSEKLLKYGDIIALENSIDATYTATSKRLLNILYSKYKLMEHLTALKRYLILGQGDFIQYLMGQLGPGLSNPANTLHRHNLTGTLEAAIRASNAQYDDPEILRRLDVRLLEVSPGECGWDVFSLDYHVDSPINTIFTPQAMEEYLRLFNFLWRLKRVEYGLSDAWRRQTTSARNLAEIEELKRDINSSRVVCNEMIHFVYQLQYYILFEVIECSWDELVTDIEKKSGDLDSLIEAHNRYLNNNYLERVSTIIAYILQYMIALEELYKFAANSDNYEFKYKRNNAIRVPDNLKDTLKPIQQKLADISLNFKAINELMNFLTSLAHHHDTDLRFLSVRLDFNEFYHHASEKEGNNNKGKRV
ncbi:10373_t:CDS:10 [Ambispora gerdemannii]|uniref:10373_t:CDS:1 n=1 Tax=Ambispora gerdemannii TaxID=144530 RepID=A0A9N8ZN02_9GLOM|nr:10373_t:CDS:10 [Ambispora gerdemannii]